MTPPTPGRLAGLVAAAVVTAGCASHPARAALPPPPQIIQVTISDDHYAYNPLIHPGRVVFNSRNVGRVAHTILIAPVSDDYPPVDEQLHGKERRSIDFLAGTRLKPGASSSFALDLVAGQRYYMVDFDRAPDGEIYALKGLDSEFRAR